MRHLARVLAVCSAVLAPGAALALSCIPPDVAGTYQEAAASKSAYVVVHGTLVFDESLLPKTDWDHQEQTPQDTFIPARFTGKSMSKAGFKTPFDRDITLHVQCFGPWCGGAASGTEYLAFLERGDDGYVLSVNACGGFGFAEPGQKALKRVVTCYRGGTCEPKEY